MKRIRFNHVIIIFLAVLSVVFFILQQLIFGDMHESGFLFFQDLMFLPLHILLVTFILDRILHAREKRERLEQLNIVIGAFFSEMGTNAFAVLNSYIFGSKDIQELLDMNANWSNKEFDNAAKQIQAHSFNAHYTSDSLAHLQEILPQKKTYLLQMFSNPNLFEHDTFTDMLWALYHLIDELENRVEISTLPATDIDHLSGDIVRAYGLLITEWVMYMKYLKTSYPYLWSLAVRKNPFVENQSVIIK